MVRPVNLLSSVALGLTLAWSALPLAAQDTSGEESPTPARVASRIIPSDDDSTDISNDDRTTDDDDATMPADESDDVSSVRSDVSSEYGNEDESPADTSDGQDSAPEVIKERYPNGSVKTEREVTQDAQGNYVNHGQWRMFDQAGNLSAQGEYRYGNRQGTWIRWYRSVTEAAPLSKAPFQQFAGPYISQATFKDDQLDGMWTIYDGRKHKISQWEFRDGKRHGMSTWWYPNGRKMREIQFRDGEMDGQVLEWGAEGSVLTKDTYQGGRKLSKKSSTHTGGGKKSEGMYLFAKEVEQTPDDWWNFKLYSTTKTGKDEKHGPWASWYSNGQKQLEGNYEHDVQIDTFTWWHSNGQKALEGTFDHGKQDGRWTWWYASGQKSIQGEYVHGNPTGRWTWWKEDGKVVQSADLSHSEGVVVDTPKVPEPESLPQVKKPSTQPRTLKR